jgi:hypothetical protein
MDTHRVRTASAIVVALSILVGIPVVAIISKDGIRALDGGVAAALLTMFDARSPGDRGSGALTSTKVRHHKALPASVPKAARVATPAEPKPKLQQVVAWATSPVEPFATFPPVEGVALSDIIPFMPVGNPPKVETLFPPTVGGPILGGVPDLPVTPLAPVLIDVPTTPSAVPEPATWLMMLLGFSMIGRVSRRRREALSGRKTVRT